MVPARWGRFSSVWPVRRPAFCCCTLLLGFALAGYRHRIALTGPAGLIPVVVLSNLRSTTLFYNISFICVFWGLVNLLPIYPLDGGQIAREILLLISPRDGIRQSLALSIFAAVADGRDRSHAVARLVRRRLLRLSRLLELR